MAQLKGLGPCVKLLQTEICFCYRRRSPPSFPCQLSTVNLPPKTHLMQWHVLATLNFLYNPEKNCNFPMFSKVSMANENPSRVNLDISVEPHDDVGMSLAEWLDVHVPRAGGFVRQTNQHPQSLRRQHPILPETRSLSPELSGGNEPQTGEEVSKTCDGRIFHVEDEVVGKKDDGGKKNVDEGVFYDCNICLDLAKDPVVTCCGHLFCWPCLYRWLNRPSVAKECPVCKGEVNLKNVTPIYGRGDCIPKSNSNENIPARPQAQRVESWRQTTPRPPVSLTLEELIGRSGSTFDSQRASHESAERFYLFSDRVTISGGVYLENPPTLEEFIVGRHPPTSPVLNSAPETYHDNNPVDINGEPLPPADVSSFAAVNNAGEIDSTHSIWDPDTGDVRAAMPRRRRII